MITENKENKENFEGPLQQCERTSIESKPGNYDKYGFYILDEGGFYDSYGYYFDK